MNAFKTLTDNLPRCPIKGKNHVKTGIGVHTKQNGNLSASKLMSIEGGGISSGDSGIGIEDIV